MDPVDAHEDEPPRRGSWGGALDRWLLFMGHAAAAILVFMMLAVSVDVLMRYFFGRPLGWTTEISEYSLLYITFLGAAWVLREDGHVSVDLLPDMLSERRRVLLDVFTSLLGTTACLLLTIYGSLVTYNVFVRGIKSITLLGFPMALVHGVIPFGSLFLTIEFARRTWRRFGEWRDGKGKTWNGGSYSY